MKKFTLNDIKEFCKKHYEEYLQERDLVIMVDFITDDYVKKVTFSSLAQSEHYFGGVWVYDGCDRSGDDAYNFNFKRIA